MSIVEKIERVEWELGVEIAVAANMLGYEDAGIQYRATSFQSMGSGIKLPIAIVLLELVDQGEVRLDDMHLLTSKDTRLGGWIIEHMVARDGSAELSTSFVIDAALRVSDNAAWRKMLEICGGIEVVQAFLERQGIEGFRCTDNLFDGYEEFVLGCGYSHVIPPSALKAEELEIISSRFLNSDRDSCTPDAAVRLLEKLINGELLKPETTGFLMDVMSRCETSQTKLRAMLPEDTRVADKTGSIAKLIAADMGFIFSSNGAKPILISVFSRGPVQKPEVLDLAIARVGRLVFDHFASVA